MPPTTEAFSTLCQGIYDLLSQAGVSSIIPRSVKVTKISPACCCCRFNERSIWAARIIVNIKVRTNAFNSNSTTISGCSK